MDTRAFENILKERVLVLDGAMGTMIQRLHLEENDFRGERFASHRQRLYGCNDLLCLTQPDKIASIHKAYIDAGADIITTNSFNSNAVSMGDYRLEIYPGIVYELNKAAASIAIQTASEAGRRVFVAGSIGPTNRAASMSPDIENPALRNVTYDNLYATYSEQTEGLIDGGADILLFETVFDTLNLKAGLDAANSVMRKKGISMPIMVSATLSDKSGRTLSGQTLSAFVVSIEDYDNVVSVGLNCSFGGKEMIPHIRELGHLTHHYVSAHPNAGLPNALGAYEETPEKFANLLVPAVEEGVLNIVGGCCGTTPEHIQMLSSRLGSATPHNPDSTNRELKVSGLDVVEVIPQNNFINVGERCNVAGSRKFLRLIKEKKYDEALQIALKQVEDGAMMIDINMDDPLLDAEKEMVTFLRLIASDPEVAKVPVMVDSSNWSVIESALKNLQGKSIVNSISLKEGEDGFIRKGKRLRELGAAVIVMAFDEKGQADTYERKIEICQRAYELLVGKCGFKPEDIIFDVNIMAVATGIEEHDRYGLDFIRAVKWVKEHLPGTHTSGGVSNLSFSFRGKNHLRECMHAVFLYHAIASGLDMGIVNPSTSVTYNDIEDGLRSTIEDVVLCRRYGASEDLAAYALNDQTAANSPKETVVKNRSLSLNDRLIEAIMKGNGEYMPQDLDEAMASGMAPVDIIGGPLMEGMNRVGVLFGDGKMFLPQVVKTARTMKQAVDYLRPHMERLAKNGNAEKAGKVLFATVKGDVHDIGKNITSIVLACNNYEVIDLGVMVPAEEIIRAIKEEKPDLVCLSGLITPSLAEMVNVAKAMEKEGFDIPLIVGGATTSKIHTALKIAPAYHAPVVHASDASQNPLIAARLLDSESSEDYCRGVNAEYERLCAEYSGNESKVVPVGEARRNAKVLKYNPVIPNVGLNSPMEIDLNLCEIERFINWKMFFHAWKISGGYMEDFPFDGCQGCISSWKSKLSESEKVKGEEALRLYQDARRLIAKLMSDGNFDGKGLVAFYPANSNGEDIKIGEVSTPLLRQQMRGSKFLSLADFVMPEDYVGVFAVTAGQWISEESKRKAEINDDYGALLLQTVSDRIAEAASEWLHLKVRRELWGYSPKENDDAARILKGDYEGIRPAFGYPMLPDQLLNHVMERLLPLEKIGVSLTENGAMSPSSSVSGLYIANHNARYFMVGEIGEDQLESYAARRGVDINRMREILRM